MGKIREHTNQMREKCVELHKSGMAIKKNSLHLKMPISTIRQYLKRWKQLELLHTCLEEDHVYLPPCTARRMKERQNNSPRITVGELQRKVASWGHQVSKTTIRRHLHANKLFGRHARKKIFLSFHDKAFQANGISVGLEFLNATRTFLPPWTLFGYMASWTPWNTRILNLNLAAPARKLKLDRHWIIQQDNDPNICPNQHKNG